MSIVARFFPNGEFSQGVDTSHKRRDRERRDDQRRDDQRRDNQRRDNCLLFSTSLQCRHSYLQWIKTYEEKQYPDPNQIPIGAKLVSLRYVYVLENREVGRTVLSFQDDQGKKHYISINSSISTVMWQWGLTPLVHQSVENCDNPKNRKQLKGMTKSMARNIRNAVYLLERQKYGKKVLSFLTLTLPSLSLEGLNACVLNWDKLVKRFVDWLRVTLRRKNIQLQHVYCTEIQPKRLHLKHEYAPHLHMVFRGKNDPASPWAVTPYECRQAWRRSIAHFVSEPFDDRALENLQRIRRSASRYLAKYLSKGASLDSGEATANNLASLRTQWGGMAHSLSKAIRQATTRLDSTGKFGRHLAYIVSDYDYLLEKNYFCYFKRGFITLRECTVTGAKYGINVCVGCLSTSTFDGGLVKLLDFVGLQLESLWD